MAFSISFALYIASLGLLSLGAAQSIAQINGNKFISPFNGQSVSGVTGLVTAIASNGIFMRSTTPDNDPATSESIFVFSKSIGSAVALGDIISLSGTVSEYRSDSSYLFLTEIIPTVSSVQVMSSNNTVTPVILGQDTTGLIGTKKLQPPTEQYTSLDHGNVYAVPNNVTQVSVENPTLQPDTYGLDFWESLSGELVTVQNPVVLDVPNSYGDTWVIGNWTATGLNSRGGLTTLMNDGNPEAILIQTPLDGTTNGLNSKLGDELADITGVITYAFGSYTIRPRTAISVQSSQSPAVPPPTLLTQSGGCAGLTVADYNVENLAPNSSSLDRIGNQIANLMNSPTILFLQEIQDNSGPTDDGTVAANVTLSDLINAIAARGGPTYQYVNIDPLDDTTGGEPGGNIRNAYLYNPEIVSLVKGTAGSASQAEMVTGSKGAPTLKYNPGLIQPSNLAFNDSRRPLVAQWQFKGGKNKFFTINNHWTSKGGSSSLFGDLRPPVNLGEPQRLDQALVVAGFINNVFKKDSTARIISVGDYNEFRFIKPLLQFAQKTGMKDLDLVVGTVPVERYSYLFAQNCQKLIHYYISPSIANLKGAKKPALDPLHINTWLDYSDRASDHDPSVAKINVC